MSAHPSLKAARSILIALTGIALLTLLVHIGFGSTSFLSPIDVVRELFRGPVGGTRENEVVWGLRLERGLGCFLVGAILGGVGSAFQALFRNPLAEPFLVGVSSGAAIGRIVGVIGGFTGFFGALGRDTLSFVGGMLSLGLVLALAGKKGATNIMTLLLSGVVVGSMLASILILVILSSGNDANELLRDLNGSTRELNWTDVAILLVTATAGSVVLILQAPKLNAFAIGEETAVRLGVNTRRLKAIVLITGTAMTAVAVGTTGIIVFVGLVAPHIARGLLGTDWRLSLGGSVAVGSVLVLAADVLSQRVIPLVTGAMGLSPVTDIPIGVVTALIGAPSLLILLRRSNS